MSGQNKITILFGYLSKNQECYYLQRFSAMVTVKINNLKDTFIYCSRSQFLTWNRSLVIGSCLGRMVRFFKYK